MFFSGHRLSKAVSIVFIGIIIGVLLLLNSRAALLSFVCGLLYLSLSGKGSRPKIRLIGIISVTVITSFLYLIRPESAQGRLYIWRVCLNMIKEKPMGFGLRALVPRKTCRAYGQSGRL